MRAVNITERARIEGVKEVGAECKAKPEAVRREGVVATEGTLEAFLAAESEALGRSPELGGRGASQRLEMPETAPGERATGDRESLHSCCPASQPADPEECSWAETVMTGRGE